MINSACPIPLTYLNTKFRQKQHSFFAGKIRRKNQYFPELIKKGRQESAVLVKDFKG